MMVQVTRLFLYALSLTQPIPKVMAGADVEMTYLSLSGTPPVPAPEATRQQLYRYLQQETVDLRLGMGHVCCAACIRGEIVAYCWMTFEEMAVEEIGKRLRVGRDEVYLYDAFTQPSWRGKGIYPSLLTELLRHSQRKGLNQALICVVSTNLSSIRGIVKAGFTHVQTILCFRALGLTFYHYGVGKAQEEKTRWIDEPHPNMV